VRIRPITRLAAIGFVGALALTACDSGTKTPSGSTTSPGGSAGKTLVISSDLPKQGASAAATESTNNAIKLYLEQIGYKAGPYTIQFKEYDDSTAAKGQWDESTCAKNAQDHVANTNEVAVMGTYNSGCAKIIAPVLNQAPGGAMLMVSDANTNPGLTKAWDPGEPQKYFPSGKRNYARVITTDDFQGAAAADFAANDLKVKKCYVLNDNQTYGQGVAKAFAERAAKNGINVLGNDAWDAKQSSYAALFQKIKAKSPDCLYIGGIYDNNGGQLVKDKFNVLGDNTAVKMIVPDGFTGYPDFQKQKESEGTYLTFAGLSTDQLVAGGGAAAKLLTDYKAKYNAEPASSYALYGVAAVQVILEAIAKSDGTRQSVVDQVFSGSGIVIPADKSVLGKEIKIDPATGDTNNKDITVLIMKSGKETFFKAQPVTG